MGRTIRPEEIPMDETPRAVLPPSARTLPARYYTDPGVFRQNLERGILVR
jgi:hypothetical protein